MRELQDYVNAGIKELMTLLFADAQFSKMPHFSSKLYPLIIESLYHCITVSLYHCIAVLVYYCITVSLY